MNIGGLKVTIEEASGMITDTNSTILGFSSSRAILSELKNSENENDLKNSWGTGIFKLELRFWFIAEFWRENYRRRKTTYNNA